MVLNDRIIDEIIPNVTVDDIPESYRDIADAIGVQNFLKLLKVVGGTTLYLPLQISVVREARNRLINREYDGTNLKELARKYNLCELWIKHIISKGDSDDK